LALLPLCTRQLVTFKPQEASSTAHAVAKAFGRADELEKRQPIRYTRQKPALPPQVAEFFSAVLPWTLDRLHEFSAQSFANIVGAFVMVESCGNVGLEALLHRIESEVFTRLDSLDPASMLYLLKAFASSQPRIGDRITKALYLKLANHVGSLRPTDFHMLARISANRLGCRPKQNVTVKALHYCCLMLADGDTLYDVNSKVSDLVAELDDLGEPDDCCDDTVIAEVPVPDLKATALAHVKIVSGVDVLDTKTAGLAAGYCAAAIAVPFIDYDKHLQGGFNVDYDEHLQGGFNVADHTSTAFGHCLGATALSFQEASKDTGLPYNNDNNRFQRGAFGRSTDSKWSCSIKNSFLHIRDTEEEAESNGEEIECKSQRSASVPSRMDLWELPESLDRWHIRTVSGWWDNRHPEMGRLDFEWGYPGKRQLPVVDVRSTTHETLVGPSLELSQILTF